MHSHPQTFADDVINQPARAQFEEFLDEHRRGLNGCLDGLTKEQVRGGFQRSSQQAGFEGKSILLMVHCRH